MNFSLIDDLERDLKSSNFNNSIITFSFNIEGYIFYNHSLINDFFKFSNENYSNILKNNEFETYYVIVCNLNFFSYLEIPFSNNSFYIIDPEIPYNSTISIYNTKGDSLLNNISLIEISSIQLMPFIKFTYGGGVPTRGFVIPVSSIKDLNVSSLIPFPNFVPPSTL